jgi:hypothetical protein
MQAIQMVVIQGASFRQVPPVTYHLDYDEPIYGGPFEERPNNLQGDELLKRLGFHGFTCAEYLRDTFYPASQHQGKGWLKKQLVVVHYLFLCEETQDQGNMRLGKKP